MTERIAYLLHQHLKNELYGDEKAELDVWAACHVANRQLLTAINDGKLLAEALRDFYEVYGENEQQATARMRSRMKSQINFESGRRRSKLRPYLTVAACLLCVISLGLFFWIKQDRPQDTQRGFGGDAAPGGNQAMLVLPNGHTVQLDSLQDGIITDASLTYANGKKVVSDEWATNGTDALLTVATPKGGQYQVTLADGTKVWLNAESSLRYPIHFEGDKRVVELEGEAFFEVKKAVSAASAGGRGGPVGFFVKTNNQTVQVLGTQFNIAAYRNESTVKTTLVTGAIKVKPFPHKEQQKEIQELLLKPGEQSVLSEGKTRVSKVNLMPFIGWRKGLFYFDETNIIDAMNQIGRWYNVEVIYPAKIPDTYFYGEISRKKSLASVLAILQEAGVQFKIQQDNDIKKLLVY